MLRNDDEKYHDDHRISREILNDNQADDASSPTYTSSEAEKHR